MLALNCGPSYDPAAGLIAMVAARALEYCIVVMTTLRSATAGALARSLLAVIWKLRRPAVAQDLGITPASPGT